MYNTEALKRAVDKFVIVLVGQPRGISSLSWRKNFPDQLKKTLYDDLSPENYHVRRDVKHGRVPWGHAPDHKPEVHVICSTWETDCNDRYLNGEDPTLAGLDEIPYIHIEGHHTEDYTERKQKQIDELDSCMAYTDKTDDGTGLIKRRGRLPIKKDKFEAYHGKVWDWCDSVRFSYLDPYELCNNWQLEYKAQTNRILNWFSPHWGGQYWHFIRAYRDHKDLFDSLTKNSIVLRIRYDMHIHLRTTLWNFAKMILDCAHEDKSQPQDLKYIEENKNQPPHKVYTKHHKHREGYDLSPIILCRGMITVAGQTSASVYWHAFDGPGACLFCEKWEEWCYEDVSRIPGLGNPDYDYTKRPSKTNRYIFPEAQLMSFINAHDYTIYDSELRSQIPLETELLSFAQLMTDQWRYDWYEGWNPSILEEIRNCEINS